MFACVLNSAEGFLKGLNGVMGEIATVDRSAA